MTTRRSMLRRVSLIAKAGVVGAALFGAAQAGAQTVTLRYSNWLPGHHLLLTNVLKPWMEQVPKVTGGRVKVEMLPKVVGSVPTQFAVVRDGLADVAFVVHGYVAGQFRAHEIMELPFLGDDATALCTAAWRVHTKHLAKLNEHAGTVPLAIFTHGPGALFTTPGPLKSVADLKGLKIRVASPAQVPLVNAVGAVPVQRPISQLYEVMSTGVVDGAFTSRESIKNFNLGRAVKHALQVPGGFYNLSMSIIVGEGAWKKISEADRAAIMKISGEVLSRQMGEQFEVMDKAGMDNVREHGGSVSTASDVFTKELKTAFKIADDGWIERAKAAGLADPAAVLAEFRAEIAKLQAGK